MCFPCCWPFQDVWLEEPPRKKPDAPKKYFFTPPGTGFYPVRHLQFPSFPHRTNCEAVGPLRLPVSFTVISPFPFPFPFPFTSTFTPPLSAQHLTSTPRLFSRLFHDRFNCIVI